MIRCLSRILPALALAGCLLVNDGGSAAEVSLNGHVFTVPDGMTIELVADSALVPHPISADFDEQGRLYVTDSSGTNDPSKKQLEDQPHRVVRLEDRNGDGVFDSAAVWAERLMFPEGALWHDGSLFVAAPPSIWKFTDANNDGVAEHREEWFKGQSLTGCANDLHGPFLGPDGWIYWCKGAFAEQNYWLDDRNSWLGSPGVEVASGPVSAHPEAGFPAISTTIGRSEQAGDGSARRLWKTRASHVFRARPDGSGLEPVMTGGMDNPVDLAFLPNGEFVVSNTFLVHPGSGKAGERDGLIHGVYGGVFGKEHGVLDGHPRTGELMPILSHLGAAAPCGLTRYTRDALGAGYRDNLFCCQFNKHKVSRHVLTPDGASFRSDDSDFVVSNNIDFHPTDVFEAPDGSLLIIDTGGWYKLCCPTSQLHKPDISGAIYRVRPSGAERSETPVVATSGTDRSPQATARSPLHDVTLNRNRASLPLVRELLKSESAHDRRRAAEAAGRIGDRTLVPELLVAAQRADDRFARHAVSFALIELADPIATTAGLSSDNSNVRGVALIALDQMPGGGLRPEQVTPLLSSHDGRLNETARWIVSRHPEWGGELAGFFAQQLADVTSVTPTVTPTVTPPVTPTVRAAVTTGSTPESVTARGILTGQLVQFSGHPAIQELLARSVSNASLSASARRLALQVIGQSRPRELPTIWAEALATIIQNNAELRTLGVETARRLPPTKTLHDGLQSALLEVANDSQSDVAVRLAALATVLTAQSAREPTKPLPIDEATFAFVAQSLDPATGIVERAAAADVVSSSRLSSRQLAELTELIPDVTPLELDRLLTPFGNSSEEAAGLQLIAALRRARSLTSLRIDSLRLKLAKYSPAVQAGIDELHALVNVDAAAQKARIEELLPQMASGDIRRGLAVFNNQKASCIACHKLAYLGGNVGPDLSRIGGIRTERDLLESILYPSLSFVRSYEPVMITLHSGRVLNGLIRDESATEITLATGLNQEVRVSRDEIDEQIPGQVSVMPAGLDRQLTVQELADLVTFLKSKK